MFLPWEKKQDNLDKAMELVGLQLLEINLVAEEVIIQVEANLQDPPKVENANILPCIKIGHIATAVWPVFLLCSYQLQFIFPLYSDNKP